MIRIYGRIIIVHFSSQIVLFFIALSAVFPPRHDCFRLPVSPRRVHLLFSVGALLPAPTSPSTARGSATCHAQV